MIDLKAFRDHSKWGTDWKPGIDGTDDWTGYVNFDGDDSFEFAFASGEDYSVELIKYVCDMHNALPDFIAIAKAALALRDAHAALDATERNMPYVGIVSADQLLGIDTIRDAKLTVNSAGDALLAALAKVTP
jgi:hypothetical protein